MQKDKFEYLTNIILDNIEGGYMHPDMIKDGRMKDPKNLYKNSGETMFGIDRVAGGNLNNTKEGKEFWGLIDKEGARKKWKWNYKPSGALYDKLKQLCIDMMFVHFNNLKTTHLSIKSIPIVENNDRLLLHFTYAAWNGPGFFQTWSKEINKLVESGEINPNKLSEVALNQRLNHKSYLIRQGGLKIQKLFELFPQKLASVGLLIFGFIVLGGIGGFLVNKFKK